ncbi:hypothetical protein [Chitinimonas sp. BJB300]|uniref:hypothetical protein n=1 Tax=Chitinimonas sp. BJB300 TaxID=1559339 RepID=UPI001E428121|nr:hypothetical protein [Chitinimonas sp. BJB300]
MPVVHMRAFHQRAAHTSLTIWQQGHLHIANAVIMAQLGCQHRLLEAGRPVKIVSRQFKPVHGMHGKLLSDDYHQVV